MRRQLAGYVLAAVLAPLLTLVLASLRGQLNLISDVLVYLVAVVVVALVGGFVPAVLLAVVGSLLLNYYFIPPIHTWTIAEANNALALGVFVVVALLVSSVVDTAARRTRQAARASAESELLTTTAGSVLRGQRAVEAVLDRVREAFGMESVTLLEREGGKEGKPGPVAGWRAVAHSGTPALTTPDDANVDGAGRQDPVPGAARPHAHRRRPPRHRGVRRLRSGGAGPAAADGRGRGRPADRRGGPDAHRAAHRGEPRPAHPAGLGKGGGDQPALPRRPVDGRADRGELLATADESLDKLTRLVGNLLDMSRLQAGALSVFAAPTGLDEVVAARSTSSARPART